MATNITQLPQISASFVVCTNADWRDVIQFLWPQGSANAGQPLDITGIDFECQVRPAEADPEVLLDISTDNGLFETQPQLGQLAFAVPELQPGSGPPYHMAHLPVGTTAVADIIARADGQVKNLGQVAGPFVVTIRPGVTKA